MIIFFYKNDGRKLKYIITGLLKSGVATNIIRLNYLQSYTIHDNKIKKEEKKAVLIEYKPENKNTLETMLKKLEINEYKIID